MNKIETFQNFLTNKSVQVDINSFIINILFTIALSYMLRRVYIKNSKSLSNKDKFSENFIIISTTTMLIITIVKSSLALSLGLVGALSIVRFRSAIKEPEELAYLFLNIGIGLGLGADQRIVTIIGVFIILFFISIRNFIKGKDKKPNLNIIISGKRIDKINIKTLIEILSKYCSNIDLIRFDEREKEFEVNFIIEIKMAESIDEISKELRNLNSEIAITYLDYNGLF